VVGEAWYKEEILAMHYWITILGGLLIMMGQQSRSEALFYYFRLEDQVPETHLLRLIEKHISFAFVREKLKQSYSETGRPSIDPELLLRILLIGYLYGISSERKLVEELRIHLAWRWSTGLGFGSGDSASSESIIIPLYLVSATAMYFAVSSWRSHCGTKRQRDVPRLTAEREKRRVHMQQFGAAFAAVEKRRHRRQIIEQHI
jgi:hypothetical protein